MCHVHMYKLLINDSDVHNMHITVQWKHVRLNGHGHMFSVKQSAQVGFALVCRLVQAVCSLKIYPCVVLAHVGRCIARQRQFGTSKACRRQMIKLATATSVIIETIVYNFIFRLFERRHSDDV